MQDDPRLPGHVSPREEFSHKRMGDEPDSIVPALVGGIMHPRGVTVLYGDPTVGKGWIACWIIRTLVEEGYIPAILDFEGVLWEWQSRLYGMGIRPDHRVEWIGSGQALQKGMAVKLGKLLDDLGVTHCILDSASASRGIVKDNDAGGQDAAMEMFRAIRIIQRPTLVIAHRGKNKDRGIIGSTQYRAQARLIWRAEEDGANSTKVWMEEVNDRPRQSNPLIFSRIPLPGGYADVVQHGVGESIAKAVAAEPTLKSQTGVILHTLKSLDRKMAVDEIAAAVRREGMEGDPVKIGILLRKLLGEGKVIRMGRGEYAYPVDQEEAEL